MKEGECRIEVWEYCGGKKSLGSMVRLAPDQFPIDFVAQLQHLADHLTIDGLGIMAGGEVSKKVSADMIALLLFASADR